MTILPTTSKLRRSPLSRGELAAICARGRHHAYNLLVRQFKQSGLSQAELASRTGIDPAMLSRIFSRPSNLEIDTMSKLLLGMGGGALMFAQEFPTAAANQLYGRSDKSDLLPEEGVFCHGFSHAFR